MAASNEVICKGVPQNSDLIGVSFQSLTNNRLDVQGCHFIGILGDKVTKFIPQLKQRFFVDF